MTSAVAICSNALLMLGDNPIASLTENTDRALACANLWPQARDYMLRRHAWACTRARTTLAPLTMDEEERFDWAYAFRLPADCMRVLQVGYREERTNYEILGNTLMCNTAVLRLVYQKRVEDPELWDTVLVDAASMEMCARLAYPITKSASLAELKRAEAQRVLREAIGASGQDNEPEDWANSPFVDARF